MQLIHTCYRIGDIDRSVAFYEALGFEEVGRLPIRDEAINVFMNLPGDGDMPRLELTYNHGVDSYELGTGYNHIAVTVDDLDGTLGRLSEKGIEPEKPPTASVKGAAALLRARPRRLSHRADRVPLAAERQRWWPPTRRGESRRRRQPAVGSSSRGPKGTTIGRSAGASVAIASATSSSSPKAEPSQSMRKRLGATRSSGSTGIPHSSSQPNSSWLAGLSRIALGTSGHVDAWWSSPARMKASISASSDTTRTI